MLPQGGARPLVRAAHGLAARLELHRDFGDAQPNDVVHQLSAFN
jgi:hypothetical protein